MLPDICLSIKSCAMDGVKGSKSAPTDKCTLGHKLLLSFCILFVVTICLTIALFVRIEMKFQQIDAAFLNDGKSLVNAKDEDTHKTSGRPILMILMRNKVLKYSLQALFHAFSQNEFGGTTAFSKK